MKGYNCTYKGKEKVDCTPCLFCKHRALPTCATPCYNCICTMDLALHKPNSETEFACFEARSEAHLKVLQMEQIYSEEDDA